MQMEIIFLNHIAEKIVACFRDRGLDECYINDKILDLEKHESKFESLAWCYRLDDGNQALLAEKLGLDVAELKVAIGVLSDI